MVDTLESQSLMRAIVENPADDTARLVYADWLDENGDHDRAEFIRSQVEWERLKGIRQPNTFEGTAETRRVLSLSYRADALLAAHANEWRPWNTPAEMKIDRWTRGFVSHVSCPSEWFAGGMDRPRIRISDSCERCGGIEYKGLRCYRCHEIVRNTHEHHSGEDYDGTWFCDKTKECVACTRSDGNAARLALAIPLEGVKLSDRRAYNDTSHRRGWCSSNNLNHGDSHVGMRLWKYLEKDKRRIFAPDLPAWCEFETEEIANDALSVACVRFAREEAGLPALTPGVPQDRREGGGSVGE